MTERDEIKDQEIWRRMNDAIRRALSTRPVRLKEVVGKSERAVAAQQSKLKKSARLKSK